MLTKTEYGKLSADWGKHGTVYQKYERYQVRFPMLLKHIDVFKGMNVLEVGCNAGLAAYHLAQAAKSYTGVEAEKEYYLQALETKKQIENENVEFKNMSIKSYMKRGACGEFEINADAAYLSYVLYHFSDKEVGMFEKTILPKLEAIIVQSRFAKRNKKGRRKHNGYGFWHPANVEKFLNKNGFSTTLEWGPDKKFHFIIGKKIAEKPLVTTMVKPVDKELTSDDKGTFTEEIPDGDNGDSGVHTESARPVSEGRGASNGSEQPDKGEPCDTAGRETDSEGTSETVLPKKRRNRRSGILQPVVEKGAEETVRDTDIQKVEKTPRTRRRSTTGKNSESQSKPVVQEHTAQGDGTGDKV